MPALNTLQAAQTKGAQRRLLLSLLNHWSYERQFAGRYLAGKEFGEQVH